MPQAVVPQQQIQLIVPQAQAQVQVAVAQKSPRTLGKRAQERAISDPAAVAMKNALVQAGKDGEEITPDQFRTILEGYKVEVRQLVQLAEVAGELGTRQKILGEFQTRDVNHLATEFARSLDGLFTIYRKSKQKRGRRTGGRANNGFNLPRFVGPALISFFRAADLGEVIPGDPSQGQIRDYLRFLSPEHQLGGVNPIPTTQAMLTVLFAIYSHRRDLASRALSNQGKAFDQQNRQLLGQDQEMENAFGPVNRAGTVYNGVLQRNQANLLKEGFQDVISTGQPRLRQKAVQRETARIAKRQQKGQAALAKARTPKSQQKAQEMIQSQPKYRVTDFARLFDPREFIYASFQSMSAVNFVESKSLTGEAAARVQPLSKAEAEVYQRIVTEELKNRDSRLRAAKKAKQSIILTPINWDGVAQAVANEVSGGQQSDAMRIRALLDNEQQVISEALRRYSESRKAATKARKAAQRQ